MLLVLILVSLVLVTTSSSSTRTLELNNLGVQKFIDGETLQAYNLFKQILESTTFDELSTSNTIFRNLAWVATILQHSTEAALHWKKVSDTVMHAVHSPGDSNRAADDPNYRSILFQSPFGTALCTHPSFSVNVPSVHKHGGEAIHLSRAVDPAERGRAMFLDLVRRTLTGYTGKNSLATKLKEELGARGYKCNKLNGICEANWDLYYASGGTTTGYTCLKNATSCPATGNQAVHLLHIELIMAEILKRGIKGDFIECGVFRGGFIVMMQAILAVNGVTDRKIIAADSYQGIPHGVELGVSMIDAIKLGEPFDPDDLKKTDWEDRMIANEGWLAENLRKLGLKDNNIQVLKGFFNESLQTLDQDSLFALVHLDSDSYEAIKESLEALYPKVSKGGYVIVDDMHLPGVQRAVAEFLLSVKGSVSPLWPVGGDYVHSCGIQNDIPSYVELKSEKSENVFQTNILHPRQQHLALSFAPYVGYFQKL